MARLSPQDLYEKDWKVKVNGTDSLLVVERDEMLLLWFVAEANEKGLELHGAPVEAVAGGDRFAMKQGD